MTLLNLMKIKSYLPFPVPGYAFLKTTNRRSDYTLLGEDRVIQQFCPFLTQVIYHQLQNEGDLASPFPQKICQYLVFSFSLFLSKPQIRSASLPLLTLNLRNHLLLYTAQYHVMKQVSPSCVCVQNFSYLDIFLSVQLVL